MYLSFNLSSYNISLEIPSGSNWYSTFDIWIFVGCGPINKKSAGNWMMKVFPGEIDE